jgi:homospermidine synthase
LRFLDRSQLDTHARAHARTNARSVGLLWTSNQPIAVIPTYTTRNKDKRRKSCL